MKKCPLLILGLYANSDKEMLFAKDANECLEDGCGWWDDFDERCSVYSIQKELARINETISLINTEP